MPILTRAVAPPTTLDCEDLILAST